MNSNFNDVMAYGYFVTRISDNMKYVGIRYANVKYNLTPNQDFGKVYFTSGSLEKEFKAFPENFKFRIVKTFLTVDEAFNWEKKIVLRVYKRIDWANNGWGPNFGENPEIGKLISKGLNRIKRNGKTAKEQATETLKDWIWSTKEGQRWREDISSRKTNFWKDISEEEKQSIINKRKESFDFKAASAKASETMRNLVNDEGLNGLQIKARKGAETAKKNGSASKNGSIRNELFNKMLGEMSEEEFENYCSGKSQRFITGCKTRRNKFHKITTD